MSENSYYCPKCKRNHRYTSKIGQEHLKYKEEEITPKAEETPEINIVEEAAIEDDVKDQDILSFIEDENSILPEIVEEKAARGKRNRISKFIHDYRQSYRVGVEKFGIWWKVFQLSIWSLALIFLITAAIILIIYLPKIEMIYWELR